MKILLLGSSGQLGLTFRERAAQHKGQITFLDRTHFDLTKTNQEIESVLDQQSFDLLINASGYTAVEKAEDEEALATKINGEKVGCLARYCEKKNKALIHFSTDYVFDGNASTPYQEQAPCAPLNAYGRSKRKGEEEFLNTRVKGAILRVSWLYSPHRQNFYLTMRRLLSEGKELKVVFDQIGTPTYCLDVVDFVLSNCEALRMNEKKRLFHFSQEGVTSWYDWAHTISKKLGRGKVLPIRSKEYPTKAVRPAYSVLDKSLLKETFNVSLRHWQDALDECFERT